MTTRVFLASIALALLALALIPAAMAEMDTKNALSAVGQITRIDGKQVTITTTAGEDTTITCVETTKISKEADKSVNPAKFADLKFGLQVSSYYAKLDFTAFTVTIAQDQSAPPILNTKSAVRVIGQLTKIEGKKLTITDTAGQETVITCITATRFSQAGEKTVTPVKFEALKVGMQVSSYYSKDYKLAFAVTISTAPAEVPPAS